MTAISAPRSGSGCGGASRAPEMRTTLINASSDEPAVPRCHGLLRTSRRCSETATKMSPVSPAAAVPTMR
jgi:hypothetical protein